MPNRILFSGCSFTASCGFSESNRLKYHWPVLVADRFGCPSTNIAIGGSSNREIFRRTVEAVFLEKFDLVIIMWSSLSRHWIYYADNNVDDFTILNKGNPLGFNSHRSEVKLHAVNHYAYFDNQYMDLREWLSMILSLQETLRSLHIPYVFIKGFDNYIREFHTVEYQAGFSGPIDSISQLLDFQNRPNDYILEKIAIIKELVDKIDDSRWMNLLSPAFHDMKVDRADDLKHPGPKANRALVEKLMEHCQQRHDLLSFSA